MSDTTTHAKVPERVRRFRADYRASQIGPHYTGWGHFALTSTVSIAVLAFSVTRLSNVEQSEWLMVPLAFLIANFAEYAGHRIPMHRPIRPLGLLYRRHTLEHHRFFTHEAMTYESSRDFKMVLFPPVMILFFLGALATPIALVVRLLWSANAGWLFVLTAMGYFLTYEWLHFAYHLPETSLVSKLGAIRALRRHHTTHHDLALMGRYNFNITFPIADWVFSTIAPRCHTRDESGSAARREVAERNG